MVRKILVMSLWVCILEATPPHSGQASPASDWHQLAEGFFKTLGEGKAGEAVDSLFATNPYSRLKTGDIENLKAYLTGFSPQLGEFSGYELVGDKDLGSRLVQSTYLAYYDRQPLRCIFVFYKRKEGWSFYNVNFDENFGAEFGDIPRAASAAKASSK